MAATPVEYQAAEALAAVLRTLPDEYLWPDGMLPVTYMDHVANTVVVTVNGVVFHAVVVAAP